MNNYVKCALALAMASAATSASAVSYIRYDVATIGSGTLIGYSGPGSTNIGGFYFHPFYTFDFSYVVALNSPRTALSLTNSAIYYGAAEASYFQIAGGASTMSVDATTIAFTEVTGPWDSMGLRASACLADSRINQFPTGPVALSPDCGAVEFKQQLGKYSNISFTGRIASITGTPFEGDDVQPGYTNVGLMTTFVPEPHSWLLMLGGFAMVGGAMRRRRRPAGMAHA